MPRKKTGDSKLAEQWRKSGQTQKAFCEENGITVPKLQYWLKKDKKISSKSSLVKLEIHARSENSFILEIDRKYRLSIPANFDSFSLKRLLETLS